MVHPSPVRDPGHRPGVTGQGQCPAERDADDEDRREHRRLNRAEYRVTRLAAPSSRDSGTGSGTGSATGHAAVRAGRLRDGGSVAGIRPVDFRTPPPTLSRRVRSWPAGGSAR